MEKKCKYKKCRLEAKEGKDYCKYHIRVIKMDENMSTELREELERIRKERYPED